MIKISIMLNFIQFSKIVLMIMFCTRYHGVMEQKWKGQQKLWQYKAALDLSY